MYRADLSIEEPAGSMLSKGLEAWLRQRPFKWIDIAFKENRPCKQALYNGLTAFGSITVTIIIVNFDLQLL